MGTGIEVMTKISCVRPSCKSVVIREGSNQSLPDDWARIEIHRGETNFVLEAVCPKCLLLVDPPPKKKRSDAGKPCPKRGARKGMIETDAKIQETQTQKDTGVAEEKTVSSKASRKQGTGRKCKNESATSKTEGQVSSPLEQVDTPASAAKWREEHGQRCPGCHIDDRKVCILTGVASLDCWNSRPNRGG